MAKKHPLDVDGMPTGGAAKKFKPDDDGDVEMADAEDDLPGAGAAGLFDPLEHIGGFAPYADIVEGTEFSTDPLTSSDPLGVGDEPDPVTTLEDLDYTDLLVDLLYPDYPEDEHADQSSLIVESSPLTAKGASEITSKGISIVDLVTRSGQMGLEMLKLYIPHHWESAPDKRTLKAGFKRVDNLDNETHGCAQTGWIGVNEALGEGGQGCTRLFVKLNEEGRIVDQIAVKETYENVGTWRSTGFWHEHREGKDPREAIIHRMLTLKTPQNWERYIIGYKGHSVNHKNKTHRTYMEYVDGGDLYGLFKAQGKPHRHINKYPEVDPDQPKSSHIPTAEGVPEAFVWYFLKQMVTAMHRMNNIPLRGYRTESVVHQDIKPANIFLGRCNPNEFPMYPIMKIGDFGSARITSEDDLNNPQNYNDAVTAGYIAPEMSSEIQTTMPNWKLSSATNVWQIATTAVQMMTGNTPQKIIYRKDEALRRQTLGELKAEYSDKIVDILRQMLDPVPEHRPDCQDILKRYYECKEIWQDMADPEVVRCFDTCNMWLHWREGDGKWGIGKVLDNPERSEDKRARKIKRLEGDLKAMKKKKKDDGGGAVGEEDDGDEYDGPKSTVKRPKKPPPAGKQPRKILPGTGPKKPSTAAESDDDGSDTTKKGPMKPPAGKNPPTGLGKGKKPPEKGPPAGTGKGPPAGVGKHPPEGIAPGDEEEETGVETSGEAEETSGEVEETGDGGGEEEEEEEEAYEHVDEYAYEDVNMDASTSGSKYEPGTSDVDMEGH